MALWFDSSSAFFFANFSSSIWSTIAMSMSSSATSAPEIGDVLHQDALARIVEDLVAHLRQRHAEEGDVVARRSASSSGQVES